MALGAAAFLALMLAARLYGTILPAGASRGAVGCGFWAVCAAGAAALAGGAIWLWRRDDDD